MAKGLGKGLGALMGDYMDETPQQKSPFQMLPLHKVEPNPNQPRRDFDPEELQALARLRLENPDMSLRDLGAAMEPPLSRSGVNHRLQRIWIFDLL